MISHAISLEGATQGPGYFSATCICLLYNEFHHLQMHPCKQIMTTTMNPSLLFKELVHFESYIFNPGTYKEEYFVFS